LFLQAKIYQSNAILTSEALLLLILKEEAGNAEHKRICRYKRTHKIPLIARLPGLYPEVKLLIG
jgi:hypothetical protein